MVRLSLSYYFFEGVSPDLLTFCIRLYLVGIWSFNDGFRPGVIDICGIELVPSEAISVPATCPFLPAKILRRRSFAALLSSDITLPESCSSCIGCEA